MDSSPQPSITEAISAKALTAFYEQHIYPCPNWDTTPSRQLQFLLAVQAGGQAALFEQAGPTLTRATGSACIGSGSDLGQYLQEARFARDMDIRDGQRVVAHLLKQVKTYSPFCGGESQIVLVPHAGHATFVEASQVLADEQTMGVREDGRIVKSRERVGRRRRSRRVTP